MQTSEKHHAITTNALAAEYAKALRTVGGSSAYLLVEDGFRRGSLVLQARLSSASLGCDAKPALLAAEHIIRQVEALTAHEREEVDRQTLRTLRP